jgi:hypothetical protein
MWDGAKLTGLRSLVAEEEDPGKVSLCYVPRVPGVKSCFQVSSCFNRFDQATIVWIAFDTAQL